MDRAVALEAQVSVVGDQFQAHASAFSPTTSHVVTGTHRAAWLWDRTTGKHVARCELWTRGPPWLLAAATFPQGELWALGARWGVVAVRHTADDELQECYTLTHPEKTTAVHALPCGRLVTGCHDGKVRCFHVEEEVATIPATGQIAAVTSCEESVIVYGGDRAAGFVDLRSNTVTQTLRVRCVRALGAAPSGCAIAAGCEDGVKVFDMRQTLHPLRWMCTECDVVDSVEFLSPTYLLIGDREYAYVCTADAPEECVAALRMENSGTRATAVNGCGLAVLSGGGSGCKIVDVSAWVAGAHAAAVVETDCSAEVPSGCTGTSPDIVRLPPGFDD
eukprot:NODE_1123_length_1456_cov_38.648608_g1112_i0.p1 GENE.NODE_1123_length_1456_cov_38.648608_g1112_i0~~NODE_1123_length_1456_cov_38.648608_g1112_i0.p1  ORF type:complete len:364 (+),score=42.63 NODE_1123_length_1456_cov_38.648608_g1112_i0:96-1094(+)